MDKFFLQSKTILGAIVTILPVLSSLFGFHFTGDEGAMISGAWDNIIQAVGAILVVWGRVTAKDSITLNPFK